MVVAKSWKGVYTALIIRYSDYLLPVKPPLIGGMSRIIGIIQISSILDPRQIAAQLGALGRTEAKQPNNLDQF